MEMDLAEKKDKSRFPVSQNVKKRKTLAKKSLRGFRNFTLRNKGQQYITKYNEM